MLTFLTRGTRSRRAVRLLCGALSLMLVASSALAAMGVCIAKAPVAATSAADPECPQHVGDLQPAGQAVAHCPQEDPGAQARTADIPAAYLAAAPAFNPLLAARCRAGESSAAATIHVPPEPLYARLSRLLL